MTMITTRELHTHISVVVSLVVALSWPLARTVNAQSAPPPSASPPASSTPEPLAPASETGESPSEASTTSEPSDGFPEPGVVEPATSGDATPSAPDNKEDTKKEYDARSTKLNEVVDELLGLPQVPAAFAIGTSTEQLARPGDLRSAVASISTAIGKDGSLKPGIAVEIAPGRLLAGPRTVNEWNDTGEGQRILESFRISFATAEDPVSAGTDSAATLASFGLRVSLIDDRDYRYNAEVISAVRAALTACFPSDPPAPGEDENVEDFGTGTVSGTCDDQKLEDDLAKIYGDGLTGWRLEWAGATTFVASSALPSGSEADWRALRTWLALDHVGEGRATYGFGLDYTLDDTADDSTMPLGETTKLSTIKAGGRVGISTPTIQWDLPLAYEGHARHKDDFQHSLLAGTSVSFKFYSNLAIQAGLQARCPFEKGHTCDAAVIASLVGGAGETIWNFARMYQR